MTLTLEVPVIVLPASIMSKTDASPFTVISAVPLPVILLLFMLGYSLAHAVLRRAVKPGRFGWWYGGVCLALGLAPMLVLAAVEAHLSRSAQLQSTQEQFRVAVVFASSLALPYLAFFAFVVLALRNPLYRDRLTCAFGVSSLGVVGPQRRRQAPATETSVLG